MTNEEMFELCRKLTREEKEKYLAFLLELAKGAAE